MSLLPRTAAVVSAAVLVSLVRLDARRPPTAQWTTRLALRGLAAYHKTGSPALSSLGVRCRFTPTCSRYAQAVLEQRGFAMGSVKALGRVLRCGPWTHMGTVDRP